MRSTVLILLALSVILSPGRSAAALDLDRLDEPTVQLLNATLAALEPLIAERRAAGTLPLITFEELYAPLTAEQRALGDAIREIDPAALQGASRRLPPPVPDEIFERLEGQVLRQGETPRTLDAQYLPRGVFLAYQQMMQAMRRDLGRVLLVESGYRSPAHQLYLFLYYLPTHGHSIRETNRHVALPGCSEHGSPDRQAIDFITEAGVNGEENPDEFEALPEYGWLQSHAQEYGFSLSYPRDNPTNSAFEPWHWHYEP